MEDSNTEAEIDLSTQAILKGVKRPRVIYFMALWTLFGISGFLTSAVSVLTEGSQDAYQIGIITVLFIAFVLIVYILQMRRHFIITFGVLCVLLAVWQSINLIGVLLSGYSGEPVVYFLLFHILPSTLLASFAFKPKLLELADNFRRYKHFELMRKASLKAMRK